MMIIKKVALKNIKSYGEDVIEFQEGITSIHGLNGAGKSTVLESIGYALFDSLPYNQSEFVRKGEKSGEIVVTIVGMDDLEYTITRKCGSSQSYTIRGGNGIQMEGKEYVGTMLCDILGYRVPDIGQLRSLFENAVGVLQGTFVSEFLESASKRKSIFDPLLRIDEYNTAHKNLLQLKNYVKGSIDEMEKKISYLEGKCEPRESLILEKEGLTGHVSLLKKERLDKNEQIQLALKEKERYDAIESALRDLESKRKVTFTDAQNKRAYIERIKAELKKSEEAMGKLKQNEAAYRLYSSKMAEKEALEKQRLERDSIITKINFVKNSIAEMKGRLGECERSIKEMDQFEAEIKTLEPLVVEQEKLDTEMERFMSEISSRTHELGQLKERMSPLKTVKGNMCPVLSGVECKSVTDLKSYYEAELSRLMALKSGLEAGKKEIADKQKALGNPKLSLNVKKESLKKKAQVTSDHDRLKALMTEKQGEQVKLVSELSTFSSLENQFKTINEELTRLKPAYDEYQQNIRIAGQVAERQKELDIASAALEKKDAELKGLERELEEKKAVYVADAHVAVKSSCEKLRTGLASLGARIDAEESRIKAIDKNLEDIEESLKQMASLKEKRTAEIDYLAFIERARDVIRMAGPEVIRVYIDLISREATGMYCEIAGDHRFEIRWTADYDIILIEDGRERTFRQLSGGEQMSAALAVRLAVLKILTSSDIVFLDEPTQNLDESRRERLAQEIMRIKDFKQMIIISHDDTFNASLENVIEIEKLNGESKVRRRNARPQATLS
ncbi:putative DNA double-strand break repair Rad50 ATPase [Methanocella paludicola SANAE]|uniref:DNA double-strand break repair Rad50 ATPase n=1 Tax=Methanocella paludicola (strain DSM 17711 / JCM 13418 / NBRC 101707 / SANAE) TaxID=304371 RepID=D1YYH2_METPS|nr:AAA family ATPase [Methanocella paludicola]BAI61494.1 putative DNA double-strand break repair Rad50 ATPase [Methanocella paludicola SANAE]